MKFISYFLVFFTGVYLSYGLVISQVQIKPIPLIPSKIKTKEFFDYRGVINVHSQEGSGQGTIPEILKAAYNSKLDFIIFTENSSFERPITKDRYEENILVLNGREYSYLKSRLILLDPNFDFSKIKNAGDAHLFLSDYLENNSDGFVLLKHPTKVGYEWEGEFAAGLDAIEIISLRSHWRDSWDQSKWNFISSLLMYPFNPEYSFLNIYQIPKSNLNLWYKISKERRIVGLLGSDAKSKLRLWGNKYLRFPSYRQLFMLSSNHIILNSELTGQLKADSTKVFNALSQGQFYFSLDFLGDPKGFNFYAKNIIGPKVLMGQATTTQNTELCFTPPASFPERSWASVYLNGNLLQKIKKQDCIEAKESGTYNIIVYRKVKRPWPLGSLTVPWIYSNFIYLR